MYYLTYTKIIKPVNQLRMIEGILLSIVYQGLQKERIFYIDVGNLPKDKDRTVPKDVMNRYRNKLVYDDLLVR